MTMKKVICLVVACFMIVLLAACAASGNPGDAGTGKNKSQSGVGQKSDDHPRLTCYDGAEGMKWAAALQNGRLVYNYGEDRNDGKGVVSLPFEFLNCADCHYHCGYTVSGFDDALEGRLPEADDHMAVVFKDGKGTLYDFYRKLIVDDYPYPDSEEDRAFLPKCPETDAFNLYEQTKDYEEGTKQAGDTDIFCERIEKDAPNELCDKARSCELRCRIVSRENADFVSEYKEYVFAYDPDTEVTLHADFYLVSDAKYAIDEKSGKLYAYRDSSLRAVLDVTGYDINTVAPQDVQAKISSVMSGHESEYKHISFAEYNEIFA